MIKEKEKDNLYAELISKGGLESQMCLAVEECAEFIQAVNKLRRAKTTKEMNKRTDELRGEIADVLNTMEQMRFVFGKLEVDNIRMQKFERVKKLIAKNE